MSSGQFVFNGVTSIFRGANVPAHDVLRPEISFLLDAGWIPGYYQLNFTPPSGSGNHLATFTPSDGRWFMQDPRESGVYELKSLGIEVRPK